MPKEYQVKPVEAEWFEQNVNCMDACPVHTNAGAYVVAVSDKRYKDGYLIARLPNPFPSICGRVCAAPCETKCRRSRIDEAIAIRPLKRFLTERYGVESFHGSTVYHQGRLPTFHKRDVRVAIVGGGPAGLSAAHDLALLGYQVTVFEAQSGAGGMLYLGIPEYRLPREIIRREIGAILDLGIELKLNSRLGEDLSIQDLRRQGYRAIFLAVGAQRSRDLRIEGVQLDGVFKAVEFLLNVNLGFKVDLGERVVVIGGGNVALDAARTALRVMQEGGEPLGLKEIAQDIFPLPEKGRTEELAVAMDAARSAIRMGAKEVRVVSLESREEMPATDREIMEAEEEGIIFHPRLGPNRILGKKGKVIGLETVAVRSVFDSQGRFNPVFIPDTESIIPADSIILAIGQTPDLSFIRKEDGIEISDRGTVAVDGQTLATTASGVFVGGDVAFGPRNLIDAIADGRRAALSIHHFLSQKEIQPHKKARTTVLEGYRRIRPNYDQIMRHSVPSIPIDRRIGIREVEVGYEEETAIWEGRRCLKCFLNIHLDPEFCILCGGCMDICPYNLIHMVSVKRVRGLEQLENWGEIQSWPRGGIAMILDEDLCIRCGLCVNRCPTGAITMRHVETEEVSADEK